MFHARLEKRIRPSVGLLPTSGLLISLDHLTPELILPLVYTLKFIGEGYDENSSHIRYNPSRLLRPLLPASSLCASTSRNWGSFGSLSIWFTPTCLEKISITFLQAQSQSIPFKVIWSRILVFSFRTKRTEVAWRLVYSCTRPCLIISFFLLKPFPPTLLAQPDTGQK